jgi:uncharacterized GH25 family protein
MKTHLLAISLLTCTVAVAHDSWVETDRPAAAPQEVVRIDLKLGNHGNDHRDFKVMGVVDLPSSTLEMISPTGERTDLKPALSRIEEGEAAWWRATHRVDQPGLWTVASTSDRVVRYAPKRSIKSAKTHVIVGDIAQPKADPAALGHTMELVALPGDEPGVMLLFRGRPLPSHRVSCIPHGATLADGFDDEHEQFTDEHGIARFKLKPGIIHLIVAHHEDDESGEGYTATKYSATLTIITVDPAE